MTAVEWLEKEFVKLEHTIGVHNKMYELIEQAKEMEKQQIIDAYDRKNLNTIGFEFTNGKEYFDETFTK